MNPETDIHTNLPLTEATFFILLSLADEPKHGYAIMKDVQILSEGRAVLGTGTLYGALKRLLEQNWIERVGQEKGGEVETDQPGRPRKAYALTRIGRRVLEAEIARLQRLVTVAGLRTVGEQI